MSSASQAASQASAASVRSPSPSFSLGPPGQAQEIPAFDPFAIIPDTPQDDSDEWQTVSDTVDGIVVTVEWLEHAASGAAEFTLLAADKVSVALQLSALLAAMDKAGVQDWGSKALKSRLQSFSEEETRVEDPPLHQVCREMSP